MNLNMQYILISLLLTPIGANAIFLVITAASVNTKSFYYKINIFAHNFANFIQFVILIQACFLLYNFDFTKKERQFKTQKTWIANSVSFEDELSIASDSAISTGTIDFIVSIDTFGILLLIFFILIFSFIFLYSLYIPFEKVLFTINSLFLLEFFLFGTLCSGNLFFILFFMESSLIPLYLLIGIKSYRIERIKAATYLFFYTIFSGILLIIGTTLLFSYTQTLDIEAIIFSKNIQNMLLNSPFYTKIIIWFCFTIALSIKIPIVPFHIWLPKAHVEAPTEGSICLASFILKLPFYVYVLINIQILHEITILFAPFIRIFSFVGALYICFIAIREIDGKRLFAYSSIIHSQIAVSALHTLTVEGILAALLIVLAHSLVAALGFAILGAIQTRMQTRNLMYMSGLATVVPKTATILMFTAFAMFGVPFTATFPGEFCAFFSFFKVYHPLFACFFVVSYYIFSIIFVVIFISKIYFGNINTNLIKNYYDISFFEFCLFLGLICIIIVIGIKPTILEGSLTFYVIYLSNFFSL